MNKTNFANVPWLLAAVLMLGSGTTRSADITATPGSLANHVWARYANSGNLPSGNQVLTTGVFNYAAFGVQLPVPAGPSFTVSRISSTGSGTMSVRAIGQPTYQPGHQPTQGTGYPGLPAPAQGWPQQIEYGGGSVTVSRYEFSEALPTGSILWGQDVDTGESTTVSFYSCAGTLVDPSGFDTYVLSQQANTLPARTFNTTNVVIGPRADTLTEATFGIVIRSASVCTVELNNTTGAGSNQYYFSIPRPRLVLRKALAGSGRRVPTDQFTVEIRNASNTLVNTSIAGTADTSGTGTTVSAGTGLTGTTFNNIGSTYTLREVGVGGTDLSRYVTAIACTNADTTSATVLPTGAGQNFNISFTSLADDIDCTLTNSHFFSNLSLTKTNTPASGATDLPNDSVVAGTTTTYSLILRNSGPDAITNARLTDTPSPTLQNCTLGVPACTVSAGSGTCPSVGTAAGQLSIANLAGAGVSVPLIADGGTLTFLVSCTVSPSP